MVKPKLFACRLLIWLRQESKFATTHKFPLHGKNAALWKIVIALIGATKSVSKHSSQLTVPYEHEYSSRRLINRFRYGAVFAATSFTDVSNGLQKPLYPYQLSGS